MWLVPIFPWRKSRWPGEWKKAGLIDSSQKERNKKKGRMHWKKEWREENKLTAETTSSILEPSNLPILELTMCKLYSSIHLDCNYNRVEGKVWKKKEERMMREWGERRNEDERMRRRNEPEYLHRHVSSLVFIIFLVVSFSSLLTQKKGRNHSHSLRERGRFSHLWVIIDVNSRSSIFHHASSSSFFLISLDWLTHSTILSLPSFLVVLWYDAFSSLPFLLISRLIHEKKILKRGREDRTSLSSCIEKRKRRRISSHFISTKNFDETDGERMKRRWMEREREEFHHALSWNKTKRNREEEWKGKDAWKKVSVIYQEEEDGEEEEMKKEK